jgi:hypothetical protein
MTKLMLILMLLGGAADLASTEYVLAGGGIEANPLAQNRAVRIAANVVAPVAFYFALQDKPRAAKVVTAVYVGLKVAVTAHNFYVGASIRW